MNKCINSVCSISHLFDINTTREAEFLDLMSFGHNNEETESKLLRKSCVVITAAD